MSLFFTTFAREGAENRLFSFLGNTEKTYRTMNKKLIYLCMTLGLIATDCMADRNSITPGETWNDTSGSAINAHGGCVLYQDGYYYWFGEDRTKTVCNGVSCYRSADLYNWTRLGLALTPSGTMTDDGKDIAKGRTLERPKVIYNERTGKWVMWVHWENGDDYSEAKVCVAQADQVEGPYELVDVFRPNGCDSRDQTLFLDTDGTAYHIYSTSMNTNTNISPLKEDYLSPEEEINTQMVSQKYEAAAVFKTGETYYGLFSGCTSWDPNKGRFTYAYDMMGDWTFGRDFKDSDGSNGSNFCVDSGKDYSYQSQSAYVLPVEGKERCYIYMGDRWNSSNVGGSKYVWLPLSVRSGYPSVRWYDEWDMSVFDSMYRYKRVEQVVDGEEVYLLERKSNRLVSRPKTTLTLQDDGESNLCFVLHETESPYTYKIEEKGTGTFMTSVYGSIRFQTEAESEAQMWTLWLEEDGYYRIENLDDGKCLSVSGNETIAGTSVYLNDQSSSIHQSFALYFDSEAHPDEEEADLYSASYREENLRQMEEQEALLTGIGSVRQGEATQLWARVTKGGTEVEVYASEAGEARIDLVEAGTGRVVWQTRAAWNGEETKVFPLQQTHLKGVYVLRVRMADRQATRKIVMK